MGKGKSSVNSLVFTASSIITMTQEYVRTSSQQQISTQVHGAKINPQVNHVYGLKRRQEGKGGGGLGNLLVSAHDGVCINELQVGNKG